jgi:hypothetical protein
MGHERKRRITVHGKRKRIENGRGDYRECQEEIRGYM